MPETIATRPDIRSLMVTLWATVGGLIVTQFIRESYYVLDRSTSLVNLCIICACAIFLSKQVADCSLYYVQLDAYDPKNLNEKQLIRYVRYLFENTVEVAVIVLVYGAIHRINVLYVDKTHQLTQIAGHGLLMSAAGIECAWLAWDLLYAVKRLCSLCVGQRGRLAKYYVLLHSRISGDRDLRWWILFNFAWTLAFFSIGRRCLKDYPSPITHGEAIWLLLLLFTHSLSYLVCFRGYYLGILSDLNVDFEIMRQLQTYDLSINKVRLIQRSFRTKITLLKARYVHGFRQASNFSRRLRGIVQKRRR